MTLCIGSARGKHFNQWSLLKITWLLSTFFWYCLVQNENMQRPPQSSLDTHSHEGGGKTNCETSSVKSYGDNLTTYITTELMSNSVQYAHLRGGGGNTKLKRCHCWGLMQICLLQKIFNWLCQGINKFLGADPWINIFTRRNRKLFHPGSAKVG